MPEIGTSGSMSGDGKRSVAEWPKLPRPSSTLPKRTSSDVRLESAFRGKADYMCSERVFRLLTQASTASAVTSEDADTKLDRSIGDA